MPTESEQKLIESLYEITIDPEKFDDLFSYWSNEFVDMPPTVKKDIDSTYNYGDRQLVSASLESHVRRALAILEMTNASDQPAPTIKQMVEADPLPTFILSVNKQVLIANDAALVFFKLDVGQKLVGNRFAEQDIEKIDLHLADLSAEKPEGILAIIQSQDDDGEASLLFALTKIHDVKTANDYMQISVVQTTWNHDIGKTIQAAFGLSDAELDIAKRFVAGESLPDIAKAKQRSINTVRTQSKTLFRKTKLKTQTELVRLFSALQLYSHQDKKDIESNISTIENANISSYETHIITRENGRELYYETYGDPDGQPVLFMHAAINGTKLSRYIISYLHAHKIKLISPHREGFGHSDRYLKADVMDNFVADMHAILDAENVDKFKVIGNLYGSFYAYYLGHKMPERIVKMRVFNTHLPVETKGQFADMTPQMKVLAYTSAYIPQLLPFLLRSTGIQLKKFGSKQMAEKYYRYCASDYALTQDAELIHVIKDGFDCAFGNGSAGIVQNVRNSNIEDWSYLIAECKMPIELFHGDINSFTPVRYVKKMAARYEHVSLEVVDGGELILLGHPHKLLENL